LRAACEDARRERGLGDADRVSKTFSADAITPVIEAGQRVFGENRVPGGQGQVARVNLAYSGLMLI